MRKQYTVHYNESRTMYPSHLCFKSRELAEYAAVHFIEKKWAGYLKMNS